MENSSIHVEFPKADILPIVKKKLSEYEHFEGIHKMPSAPASVLREILKEFEASQRSHTLQSKN